MNSAYRVLCKNNTLAKYNQIDEDCALVTIVNSEILTREDQVKNMNIRLLLQQIEKQFHPLSQFRTMNAFTTFRGAPNILFRVNLKNYS